MQVYVYVSSIKLSLTSVKAAARIASYYNKILPASYKCVCSQPVQIDYRYTSALSYTVNIAKTFHEMLSTINWAIYLML